MTTAVQQPNHVSNGYVLHQQQQVATQSAHDGKRERERQSWTTTLPTFGRQRVVHLTEF